MSESWPEFAKRQSDYAVELERRLTTAERERDEARREEVRVANERNDLAKQFREACEQIDAQRHRAERMERVVEAAKAYEKWMGKWHDYSKKSGLRVSKPQTALINAVRALDASGRGDG